MRKALVALLLVVLALAEPARAATDAQVKAAYLLRLTAFVRWPSLPTNRLRICTFGRPEVAAALAQLASRQSSGPTIELSRVEAGDTVQQCRVLFLGSGGEGARALHAAAGRAPILIVTDRDNGSRGGAIEFVQVGGRVRFVIDRSDAMARSLSLSSKLFDVALGVTK